jgi:hypothetical protein
MKVITVLMWLILGLALAIAPASFFNDDCPRGSVSAAGIASCK